MKERSSVWIDGMAEQISKHTVKPRTFTQIGSQSKSANRAAWCDEQVRKLLMDLRGLEILSCAAPDVWRMAYFFLFYSCRVSAQRVFETFYKPILKNRSCLNIQTSGRIRLCCPPHISLLLHSTVIFDMIDAATAGRRFISIISSAAASKNPKADTSVPS